MSLNRDVHGVTYPRWYSLLARDTHNSLCCGFARTKVADLLCSCAHMILRLVLWFIVQHLVALPMVIPWSLVERTSCFGDPMSPELWIPYFVFSVNSSEGKLSEVLTRESSTSY